LFGKHVQVNKLLICNAAGAGDDDIEYFFIKNHNIVERTRMFLWRQTSDKLPRE
jgi:hypothetical protein